MTKQRFMKLILLMSMFIFAACAPENLDITPTVAPTDIPKITVYVTGAVANPQQEVSLQLGSRASDAIEAAGGPTENADMERVNIAKILIDGEQVHVPKLGDVVVETTPEPTPEVIVPQSRQLAEHLADSLPGQVNTGTVQWRRANTPPVFVDREGGATVLVAFTGPGGEQMELTYGFFDTPELATAFYERTKTQLANLSPVEERSQFNTPNAFGSGTYGSSAIFVRDTFYIRVNVLRFSGTGGDPLNPLARPVFEYLDASLASFGQ